MNRKSFLSVTFLLLAATAGRASTSEVGWFSGSVEEAFAKGKADNRPLFLYWGAVWCPPCNQIKATIFNRRDFAEKMKLFVPVYLDGDTERAQIWGEKLNTKGYPTMIVFSPSGEEVMRIPGGLQLDAYLDALDQSIATMKPARKILEEALAQPDAVSESAWRLLAYYSWGQDGSAALSDVELEAAFRTLKQHVPTTSPAVRARIYTTWLGSALPLVDKKENGIILDAAMRTEIDARLRELLSNRTLTLASLDFLSYSAGDAVKSIHPTSSPDRTRLITLWEKTMDGLQKDESLSVDERISAVIPSIELTQLSHGDKTTPKVVQDRVRELTTWAEANAKDDYTRQSAMNTAGHLLRTVGLREEAKAVYLAQVEKAVSPYYFMSSLASIAKEEGKTSEAIAWMRKAYDGAKGPATRFQWGSSYLLGIMDLAPTDNALVARESLRVLKELLAADDAFAGRNNARFKRLQSGYAKWASKPDRAKTMAATRDALMPRCDAMSDESVASESSLRARCTTFFGGLGKS